jgi:hypothetical protein
MVDISVSWNDGNCPYECCDGSSSTHTIQVNGNDYDNLKVYYIVSTFYGEENKTSKSQNSWPILSLTKELVNYEICRFAWEDKTEKAKNMRNILTELVNILSEDPELPFEKIIEVFRKLHTPASPLSGQALQGSAEYLTNSITEK